MTVSDRPTLPSPQRPWLRVLGRVAGFMVKTLLWLSVWIAALAGVILATFYFSRAEWLAGLSGTPHQIAEVVARLAIAAPFLLWLVMLFHPIRTRAALARLVARAAAIIGRRSRRDAASAEAAPTADTSPAEQPEDVNAAQQLPGTLADPAPDIVRVPRPMSRRRFLGEAGLFGGLVAYSMFVEPYSLRAVEIDLPVANLPERFAGMRIAQLSDLHINAYTTAEDLERAVAVINSLNPDLVLLTGDFVDWNARYADDATRPFRKLNPREGVYSILGNHDYYSGNIERVKAAVRQHDLGLLVNEHTILRRGGDILALIGLDDPRHNRTSGGMRMSTESIDPERALRGIGDVPRLLMVHNPVIAPALVQSYPDLDAIVAGHTHGGQFQVPILTNAFISNNEYFVSGRYEMGKTQIYVNAGFGFTGPPLRFRMPPEVTLFRLTHAG